MNLREIAVQPVHPSKQQRYQALMERYHFTVKRTNLHSFKIEFYFQDCREPDFIDFTPPEYGRIETRKILKTSPDSGNSQSAS